MKNSCKGANHPEYGNALDTVEEDTKHVFQWASEFLAHHTDRAGWIVRMKAKTEGRANG